ncbi:MAG: hypothetical protein BWY06_00930 [Candidatus Latescibacteria bacterium ADurb.Bin168]|nr:MAG: hypothetical protein BWY06_00930 [Candidatus Latescibacteria bacterium ADurb.Bin168]
MRFMSQFEQVAVALGSGIEREAVGRNPVGAPGEYIHPVDAKRELSVLLQLHRSYPEARRFPRDNFPVARHGSFDVVPEGLSQWSGVPEPGRGEVCLHGNPAVPVDGAGVLPDRGCAFILED